MCIYSISSFPLPLHHPQVEPEVELESKRGAGSGSHEVEVCLSFQSCPLVRLASVLVLMPSFSLLGGGVTTLNKRNESPLGNTGLQYWSGK